MAQVRRIHLGQTRSTTRIGTVQVEGSQVALWTFAGVCVILTVWAASRPR